MGFLDIILDAVLTDVGRKRLAQGNFKITKFALGDDEINYTLFNRDHPSGSAYFDINILTTPVIEALTNNTSTMKNRLLSIPKTNLLFLPKIEVNRRSEDGGSVRNNESTLAESYIISCDATTDKFFTIST